MDAHCALRSIGIQADCRWMVPELVTLKPYGVPNDMRKYCTSKVLVNRTTDLLITCLVSEGESLKTCPCWTLSVNSSCFSCTLDGNPCVCGVSSSCQPNPHFYYMINVWFTPHLCYTLTILCIEDSWVHKKISDVYIFMQTSLKLEHAFLCLAVTFGTEVTTLKTCN